MVNVWTTNFDELVEAGIKTLAPQHSFNVYSSANKSVAPHNTLSSVMKLHGDYRYDHIKNTPDKLQSLEANMQTAFAQALINKGLVVVGYSGSDESIMSVLERGFANPDFLKYGLIWAIPTGVTPSERLTTLMELAYKSNENSGIIKIQGFDDFLHTIYAVQTVKNNIIENLWRDYDHRKLSISFQAAPTSNFTKFNAFVSIAMPCCMVFDTDITSWKQLKEVIEESGIIAALYACRIYCFDAAEQITAVFGTHIKSEIVAEQISNRMLYKTDSIYIGMLYSLIKKAMIDNHGLTEYRRNKYYDATVWGRSTHARAVSCRLFSANHLFFRLNKCTAIINF
ncbi:MAG: SIR2 family protein [Oscillospiraceae bacterium]|nr:SIR2 family protein [Oscillospiraceae bacterium]